MDRVARITELLEQRAVIDAELGQIKEESKAEKTALNSARKPRKKREPTVE